MCLFLSHRSYLSENKKRKKGVVDFDIYAIAKIVLRDIDLHVRFQMFKICQICLFYVCCRIAKIMNKIQQYIVKHLRSNAVSPVIFLRDLDLHFLFQLFKCVKFVRFRMFAKDKIMKQNQQ